MNLARYYSSKLMPFGSLSKPPKLMSGHHLEYVSNRCCIASGASPFCRKIDVHHVLKKSQGKNDYATVPLRHDIHMQLDSDGEEAVENQYGFIMKDALIATLIERVVTLEEMIGWRK